MLTIIVEKATQRLVFVCNIHQPRLFDALWPTVQYNYITQLTDVERSVRETPWHYVFEGQNIVRSQYTGDTNELVEAATRARMLMQLARATNRHRRMVMKEDLLGQDTVYRLKHEEAQRFLANPMQDPNSFPWLLADANFDGITVTQAAQQIVFRATQAMQVLQHTEGRRRYFTRRILTVPATDLATAVQSELIDYERRG